MGEVDPIARSHLHSRIVLPEIRYGFSYYYLAIVIVGISLFVLYRMEKSRIGLVWGSIKEADFLAQSIGINIMAHKIFVFVVACFFTGIAGGLYAFYQQALSPATNPATYSPWPPRSTVFSTWSWR